VTTFDPNGADPALTAPGELATEQACVRFQRYLRNRGSDARVATFERITGGFETFIYRFTLAADGPETGHASPLLPPSRRLILRVYYRGGVVERSAWEAAVIAEVRLHGVPAPEVFLYEPDVQPLGGPFLVLDLAAGTRLDQAAPVAGKLTVVRMLRNFARAQAAIYGIDWPAGRALVPPAGSAGIGPFAWVPERLVAARHEIAVRGLRPLEPLVDWLEQHHHLIANEPEVLIHGDFHPLNVFVEGPRISGIIDWGAGGFANKHEDIGWSSLLIATASAVDAAEDKQLGQFRTVGHALYMASLWEACRVDRAQLQYGEVYAGLRWMLIFLPSYLPDAGPAVLNSDAVAFTTPRFVARVRSFIEKRTGLKLAIE